MAVILYYAEFDPFAGFGHTTRELQIASREVALCCLLYDVVKVQPDSLLEHGLTLPVFEALAPFVRAGRLTTSADDRAPPPHEYLHGRVEQALRKAGRTAVDKGHRRDLEALQRRYAALMPERWIVSRSVRAQTGRYAEHLRTYLADAPGGARSERRLQGWVEAALDRGQRVDRDFVLLSLARLREHAGPRELTRLAAFAQALMLDCGAVGPAAATTANGCVIYPGRFARRLGDDDPRRAALAAPPFAHEARQEQARPRFAELGVLVDDLLRLPADELLEVAASPEWARVRSARDLEPDVSGELRARFDEARDVRDALPAAAELIAAATPAPVIPAPWQAAVQTVLAATCAEPGAVAPVLNLFTLELRRGERRARLTRAEADLCLAVALAGDAGLPIERWKQLKADADQLATAGAGEGLVVHRDQAEETYDRDRDRRNWLEVTKHHANRALSALGLAIHAVEGRLFLIGGDDDEASEVPSVALHGTLWELAGIAPHPDMPTGLSPTEGRLYRVLAESWPAPVPIRRLAAALGKDDGERALKQTTDALGKLTRRLADLDARAKVGRVGRGWYSLEPDARAAGEVR